MFKQTFRAYGLALLAAIFVISSVAAQPQSSVAGHWEGAIKLPTGPLNLSVDFTAASGGKLAATITIPQQGAKDLPLSNVSQNGPDVGFEIAGVPGEP